jgi:hypothetical protein
MPNGQYEYIRPDNIRDAYVEDAKWIHVTDEFYGKQIGKLGTGLRLHVMGWENQIFKYSLYAEQNKLSGVKIYTNSLEAARIANELYPKADYPNVDFQWVEAQ